MEAQTQVGGGGPRPPTKLIVFIPPELEKVKPDLQRFFDAMVYKLRRNSHKGAWEDLTLARALQLLGAEVDELTEAVVDGSTAEIVFEAADVANFALMTANVALRARDNDHG